MTAPIANHKTLDYDDEELCKDLAASDLSIADIAVKHKISLRHTYEIAKGESRPELKKRVDELIEAEKAAGTRLAKSRARWFMARLIQIAAGDSDVALKAIIKGLEMAGFAEGQATGDKQTIEIVLSSNGNGKADPLERRLTGVVNGNN